MWRGEQIANATQGVEKRLAKWGMEKRQVFEPDLASTNFPITFSKIRNVQRSDAALCKLLQRKKEQSTNRFIKVYTCHYRVLLENRSEYVHQPKLVIMDRFLGTVMGHGLPPDSPRWDSEEGKRKRTKMRILILSIE